MLFVRLFDLGLFGFVGFLFLLVSGKGCSFVIVALPGLFPYLLLLNGWKVIGFFSDVQNGFRKDRSCQDHVFSLYSIINNIK